MTKYFVIGVIIVLGLVSLFTYKFIEESYLLLPIPENTPLRLT